MNTPSRRKNAAAGRILRRSGAVLVLSAFIAGGLARAQEQARPTDDQVKERLSFLGNALNSGQPRARTWWYGWLAGYSAGAAVMGGLAAGHWNDTTIDQQTQARARDREFAEDMLVGGATFALGVAALLVDPFVPAYGPNRVRAMPEGTPEERRLKLDEAEKLLRQCARREKDGRGLLTHLLNLGANAAAGLVTVWAFDRPWSDGLLTFATGEAVSLANIFSQPRRAERDLANYEAGRFGRQGAGRDPGRENRGVRFTPRPGGFGLSVSF